MKRFFIRNTSLGETGLARGPGLPPVGVVKGGSRLEVTEGYFSFAQTHRPTVCEVMSGRLVLETEDEVKEPVVPAATPSAATNPNPGMDADEVEPPAAAPPTDAPADGEGDSSPPTPTPGSGSGPTDLEPGSETLTAGAAGLVEDEAPAAATLSGVSTRLAAPMIAAETDAATLRAWFEDERKTIKALVAERLRILGETP